MKSKPVSVGEWMKWARQFLADVLIKNANRARQPMAGALDSPADPTEIDQEAGLEVQLLLAQVLEKPRAWVLSHPEVILPPPQQRRLTKLLGQLVRGEPLPYLLGHWEFYGLDFEVTPAVLIPRPETELLVERGITWLHAHPGRRAADVGTGSGIIAITLAKHIPGLRVLAVDRSAAALEVARRNADRHSVSEQIDFAQGELLENAPGLFDLVCANLPYIPTAALGGLPVAEHEPQMALDGGPDGLDYIRRLVADAPRWLAPGGLLLLEMQYDQGPAVEALARQSLPAAQITVLNDLAGLPRVVSIERETTDGNRNPIDK